MDIFTAIIISIITISIFIFLPPLYTQKPTLIISQNVTLCNKRTTCCQAVPSRFCMYFLRKLKNWKSSFRSSFDDIIISHVLLNFYELFFRKLQMCQCLSMKLQHPSFRIVHLFCNLIPLHTLDIPVEQYIILIP